MRKHLLPREIYRVNLQIMQMFQIRIQSYEGIALALTGEAMSKGCCAPTYYLNLGIQRGTRLQ